MPKSLTIEQQLIMHQKLLDQIRRMYDNPELSRVIRAALDGRWDQAFYDKFRPVDKSTT